MCVHRRPAAVLQRVENGHAFAETRWLVYGSQLEECPSTGGAEYDALRQAAMPLATAAATVIVSQRRSAISASGNSRPNCGLAGEQSEDLAGKGRPAFQRRERAADQRRGEQRLVRPAVTFQIAAGKPKPK